MIKVKKLPKPNALDKHPHAGNVKEIKTAIKDKLQAGEELNSKDDFPPLWNRIKNIKDELFSLNKKKCAYCEVKERAKRTMDVEHFRPKAGVDEAPDHPGYWWLAYDSDNYVLSCKVCNTDNKGNRFPLLDESTRAEDDQSDLSLETPVLVNSKEEDPFDYISFDWREEPIPTAVPVGIDQDSRGHRTIEICGLNDPDLNEWRGEYVLPMKSMAITMLLAKRDNNAEIKAETAIAIEQYTRSDKQFSGFKRIFFIKYGLGKYIADD